MRSDGEEKRVSGKQGGVKLREQVLGVEGACRRRDVQANSVKTSLKAGVCRRRCKQRGVHAREVCTQAKRNVGDETCKQGGVEATTWRQKNSKESYGR